VRCVTAWCSKPSNPTTLIIPATNASAQAPRQTQGASFEIMTEAYNGSAFLPEKNASFVALLIKRFGYGNREEGLRKFGPGSGIKVIPLRFDQDGRPAISILMASKSLQVEENIESDWVR
jgi:hypothetical protein